MRALAIKKDIEQLAEAALRCGIRTPREVDETFLEEYTLQVGDHKFFFVDGGYLFGTNANHKVDIYDGWGLSYTDSKISWAAGGNSFTPSPFPSSDLEKKTIQKIKENLPPECYKKDSQFNCC